MIDLKRRSFLGSAAALALLPTTPASAAPVAIEGAAFIAPTALPAKPAPWWGWTDDDHLYQGPFDSRMEAIEDAKASGNAREGFRVALCHPRTLSHPRYEEAIVEWLCADRHGRSLSEVLRDDFSSSSEEHDFDGEVSDCIEAVDWEALSLVMMPILDAAVARSGFFIVEPLVGGMFEGGEAILEALATDEVFARALAAAATSWSDGNGLLFASLMVDTTDSSEHVEAPAP